MCVLLLQVHGTPVQGDSLTTVAGDSLDREPAGQSPDYAQLAQELDKKSPLEIMDHVNVYSCCFIPLCIVATILIGLAAMQALKQHGDDIGIAFSGAEDVALVEYAHLTGRPYRVFRY